VIIQAERWCDSVVSRALTTQRPIKCSAPAISLCAVCSKALCDEHVCNCAVCGNTFCSRCDHVCVSKTAAAA
jgi:hypothetical protein